MRNYFTLVFCLITISLSSQTRKHSTSITEEFIKSSPLEGASMSALAVNLTNNDTLFDISSSRRLIPASVLKVFTTGMALEKFGANFRYATQISYSGAIENSILRGDVIIAGCGDPTLGSSYFKSTHADSIFKSIQVALIINGITKIEGDIVVVDTFFNNVVPPSGRLYEDMANYYGAIPQSFCWRDNSFSIHLKSPSIPNKRCEITFTDPKLDGVQIDCSVLSSYLNKDSAYIYPFNNQLSIRGSIPVGQSDFVIKGVLPSPSLQFIDELKHYLERSNISVVTPKLVSASTTSKLLTTIYSPPLSEIIKVTNQKSINLFADALFLAMAKPLNNNWLWDGASVELTQFWKSCIGSSIVVEDGSGMSPRNLITAKQLVSALIYMQKSTNFSTFINSLSVAGNAGTLKNCFLKKSNKLFGKSGSMHGVLCYTGYYYNSKNELIAFAVMVNNFTSDPKLVRAEIEKLVCD